MAPRNMSSTTVSPVCPTDPSLAYYRRFWLALASLWLTVVSIAFVVISIKREVHLPLGPNLAKPQKLAKSTQGDSPTGLEHAPKSSFFLFNHAVCLNSAALASGFEPSVQSKLRSLPILRTFLPLGAPYGAPLSA
jgi:hypothetical protein